MATWRAILEIYLALRFCWAARADLSIVYYKFIPLLIVDFESAEISLFSFFMIAFFLVVVSSSNTPRHNISLCRRFCGIAVQLCNEHGCQQNSDYHRRNTHGSWSRRINWRNEIILRTSNGEKYMSFSFSRCYLWSVCCMRRRRRNPSECKLRNSYALIEREILAPNNVFRTTFKSLSKIPSVRVSIASNKKKKKEKGNHLVIYPKRKWEENKRWKKPKTTYSHCFFCVLSVAFPLCATKMAHCLFKQRCLGSKLAELMMVLYGKISKESILLICVDTVGATVYTSRTPRR